MSYSTNWVDGSGNYDIKSLKDIDEKKITNQVNILTEKIYKIFINEINRKKEKVTYYEYNNKYKIHGYYEILYSTYIQEISSNINLSLSSIINYSIFNNNHQYCYNNFSWRPNIYKIFTYKKYSKILDCFSSPIYPVIKPYCGLFPNDIFFDGCVGHFSLDTLNHVKPNILFAHPTIDPYTGKYCMKTIDQYLNNNNAFAMLTTNCTFGKMKNYVDTSSLDYSMVSSYILNHAFKSKNLLGFLIIPINIVSHSLIYTQNIRLTKSLIEIESAYIILFYGNLPSGFQSLMCIKKAIIERMKQNCDKNVKYNTYKIPSRYDVNKYQREYQWITPINIYKEILENIRLLRSYFDS